MRTSWGQRIATGLLAAGLILAACGDDDATDVSSDDDAEETDDTATAETDPDETTSTDTSEANEPLDDDELPGEVFDLFPYADAEMAVVGVEADDTLNVRVGPGPTYDVLTTLDPLSDGDAIATGRNRIVDSGIWAEVTVGPSTGWANTRFLLQSGATIDDTSNLYGPEADLPSAPSLVELGMAVARRYGDDEPEPTITVVHGPEEGDLGEVTLDVIGIGDDAVGGFRVHVFAEASEGSHVLRTVETTTMCSRGVGDDDVCL